MKPTTDTADKRMNPAGPQPARRPWQSRALLFGAVGSSGIVVDLTSMALLLNMLPGWAARGTAIGIAVTWNYSWNRAVTFVDAPRGNWLSQYGRYWLGCAAGVTVNWAVSVALWQSIPALNAHKWIAATGGILAGTVLNYLAARHFVFPDHATGSAQNAGPETISLPVTSSTDSVIHSPGKAA